MGEFRESDQCLGYATLAPLQFYPCGFDGNLRLSEAGRSTSAHLHVKIMPAMQATHVTESGARATPEVIATVGAEQFAKVTQDKEAWGQAKVDLAAVVDAESTVLPRAEVTRMMEADERVKGDVCSSFTLEHPFKSPSKLESTHLAKGEVQMTHAMTAEDRTT